MKYFGFEPSAAEPAEIYLFRWPAGYKEFMRKHYPQFFSGPACVFREDGKLVIAIRASRRKTQQNLRHELTHVVLASNLSRVPPWVDEGLAQYFEPGPEPGTVDAKWLREVRKNFQLDTMPSVYELIVKRPAQEFDRRWYRASWSLVHFIVDRDGVDVLVRYARMIGAGEQEGVAFARCFNESPPSMDAAWRKYAFSLEPGPP